MKGIGSLMIPLVVLVGVDVDVNDRHAWCWCTSGCGGGCRCGRGCWSDRGGGGAGGRVSGTELVVGHGECVDGEDLSPEFPQCGPVTGLEGEEALQDTVGGGGDGEDGPEKVWVVDESAESLVRGTSLSPWVAATSEIDEDDAESPDIVSLSIVVLETLEQTALTFGAEVESRTAGMVISEMVLTHGLRDSPAKVC